MLNGDSGIPGLIQDYAALSLHAERYDEGRILSLDTHGHHGDTKKGSTQKMRFQAIEGAGHPTMDEQTVLIKLEFGVLKIIWSKTRRRAGKMLTII